MTDDYRREEQPFAAHGDPADAERTPRAEPPAGPPIDASAYRWDPSRGARIADAMSRIGAVTEDRRNDYREFNYASAEAIYGEIRPILAACGLRVRARMNRDLEIIDVKIADGGRSGKKEYPTMTVDVAFAFAAPEDGPLAPLEWERRVLVGPLIDAGSVQGLWTRARRNWIRDALLMNTESDGDAAQTEIASGYRRRSGGGGGGDWDRGGHRGPDRGRSGGTPPPQQRGGMTDADYDAAIARGRKKIGMGDDEYTELHNRLNGDKVEIINEIKRRYEAMGPGGGTAGAADPAGAGAPAGPAGPPDPDPAGGGGEPPEPEPDPADFPDDYAAGGDPGPGADGSELDAYSDAGGPPPAGGPPEPAPQPAAAPPPPHTGIPALTPDQCHEVILECRQAGVADQDTQRIVQTRIGADKMVRITRDGLETAAAELGLQLPPKTNSVQLASAVIRAAAAGTLGDGTASGAGGLAKMAKESERKLAEINPGKARELAARRYRNDEERLNAMDAALEEERRAAERAEAEAAAAGPAPAEPPPGPAEPGKPLSEAEQIDFLIRRHRLKPELVDMLKQLAKNDPARLLESLRNYGGNTPPE